MTNSTIAPTTSEDWSSGPATAVSADLFQIGALRRQFSVRYRMTSVRQPGSLWTEALE